MSSVPWCFPLMTVLNSDPEHRLILASRTFAWLDGARRVVLSAVAGSRVIARLRGGWFALPAPLGRYTVGVTLATAATTHVLLATATGHVLAWTVLIIPAAVFVIGLAAIATATGPVAGDRSVE
jgi:hypothetical protein